MGTLKQITQTVKYKVPNWAYCNLMTPDTLEATAVKCRFCVGDNKNGYTCLLHNMPLGMEDRNMVLKTQACGKVTWFNKAEIVEVPDQALSTNKPMVEPKQIIKATIDEFIKVKKQLETQGFPSAMAEKLAKDLIMKGSN